MHFIFWKTCIKAQNWVFIIIIIIIIIIRKNKYILYSFNIVLYNKKEKKDIFF